MVRSRETHWATASRIGLVTGAALGVLSGAALGLVVGSVAGLTHHQPGRHAS